MHLYLESLESRILSSSTPMALSTGPLLPGDANRDGRVSYDDMLVVTSNWNASGTNGDLNGDGQVNFNDMLVVTGNWNTTLYNNHTQVINGVLNIWASNPSDTGDFWLAPSTPEALYGSDLVPSIYSIKQGQIADCYLLAAVGSMAYSSPSSITSRITTDETGWVVTWRDQNSGVPLVVHSSRELSSYLQAQTGEVWWEALEKSFALFRTWNGKTSTNTFHSLDYGFEGTVYKELAWLPYRSVSYWQVPLATTAADMATALSQHKMVTWATKVGAPSMVSNHVYVVLAINGTTVTLYNPWGFVDQRSLQELQDNGLFNWTLGG